MKIYLATWLEDDSQTPGITLTKVEARSRLLSYYLLSGKAENRGKQIDLFQYVKTGIYRKK